MKIEATVLKTLYPKTANPGENQWYVLSTTAGRVVGSARFSFIDGHLYQFSGDYSVYQGQQNFKFTTATENIPLDPRALLNYACATTKGLGPSYAQKIWDKYGSDFPNALTSDHTDKRGNALRETLVQLSTQKQKTTAIATLVAHGTTQNLAEQAYATFGDETLSLVKANPYALASLPGQSFSTIDARLREPFGIPTDSPLRAKACISYLIAAISETTGSTIIPHERILSEAATFNIPEHTLRAALESFILLPQGITTQKLYNAEKDIHTYAFFTKKATTTPPLILPEDITLDASQTAACQAALATLGLSIINGGAGCGKTTLIKTIAQSLSAAGEPINIVAFAGKAAARVREATAFPATTIHSLLGYTQDRGFIGANFIGTNIILDEASMVPAYLLAEIIRRFPKRLILVGDEAQLAPVGPGSPFHDLVATSHAHTVTTCYRNAEAIFQAAYDVRNGTAPKAAASPCETFTIIGVRSPEEAHAYITSTLLPLLDFSQDIIITPRNGTGEDTLPASVKPLNAAILQHLHLTPSTPGTRIICLQNKPHLNVWNGTTGTLSAVDIDGKAYLTLDDGGETILPQTYLAASTAPAYALTVHKAQGSQYRRVVILILRRDLSTLLDRPMLYTSITRAREGCVIITDTNLDAVTAKKSHRQTILQTLLLSESAKQE